MTSTASKETVGKCIVCEGSGLNISYTSHNGNVIGLFFTAHTPCTHCQGSGIRPQRLICTDCHGIGGHAKGRGINHSCVTCKTCAGNGWTLLRLRDGQQFESAEVLP